MGVTARPRRVLSPLDPALSGTPSSRNPQGAKNPLPPRVGAPAGAGVAPAGGRAAHHGPRFGLRLPVRVVLFTPEAMAHAIRAALGGTPALARRQPVTSRCRTEDDRVHRASASTRRILIAGRGFSCYSEPPYPAREATGKRVSGVRQRSVPAFDRRAGTPRRIAEVPYHSKCGNAVLGEFRR